jgi:hypothetical protein
VSLVFGEILDLLVHLLDFLLLGGNELYEGDFPWS